MIHGTLRILGALTLLTFGAVALGHPPDANGRPDDWLQQSDRVSTARDWTNARTGEVVRGSFLAARGGKVSIEREGGEVVALALGDLSGTDRLEALMKISESRAINEQSASAALTAAEPGSPAKEARPGQAAAFEFFAPMVKTRWDERWLYVECDGLPHAPLAHPVMVGIKSWQQQVPLPQSYSGRNAWQIPLKPELADKPVSGKTQLYRGAIALAANGVPIFNALNNRGDDALKAGELDDYGGHSGRGDDYHYHIAPLALQKVVGTDKPIGYALDGFALYGLFDPEAKKGAEKSCPQGGTEKLDELNGHFGVNADGSRGEYHYHASMTYPYINGGMRGKVTVKDDQVDPQPRAAPVRQALTPLRGATVTGFKTESDKAWSLEYTIGGKKSFVNYSIDAGGKYIFDFVAPDGGKKTETYTRREDGPPGGGGGGGGGRRRPGGGGGDDRPPPPPDGRDGDRPPPRTDAPSEPEPEFKTVEGFVLSSPAVGADGRLPAKYTCDGESQSPPLKWTKPPAGTKSLAVVMHHVPGPGDTHVYWVLFNIPPETEWLEANVAGVGVRGINTVNQRKEYAPPCSKGPGDKTYTLTVYALSSEPKLDGDKTKVTRAMLLAAIKESAIAAAKMDVKYARSAGAGGGGGGGKQPPGK